MNKCISAVSLGDYRLEVTYSDGAIVILNLSDLIKNRDSYWRCRQERYFSMIRVDPLGGLCWPEGEDLCLDGLSRYLE